ncbi:SchA/CurD [Saccharopolyspora indica]|uniref:SchA/CurD-like domain-containing protein n=1 Tax=Saccharopolyspora indica TaxID=1229659 RepID=UPI0022EB4737|nr:SchA/CurD-like domain-containing protein [Saccharopolyspora indica]MDA3647660.1 SchA/CurD [Saccharopolyspora indica]
MPYAAITYKVKPGFEDEIAEIFAGFKRASSPVLRDESGAEVGKLLGTGVFIQDGVMVRFIHYEGAATIEDIGRHMSTQGGVHEIEERLKPYLSEPRDTATPERFRAYFRKSTMRCISQLSIDTFRPGATAS